MPWRINCIIRRPHRPLVFPLSSAVLDKEPSPILSRLLSFTCTWTVRDVRGGVRKAITKLEGVDSLNVNVDIQKVTVMGYVDRREVLRSVPSTGRKAEFWPSPYDGEYHPFMSQYYEDTSFSSTYNYYRHGYNSGDQGYFPNPIYSTLDDNTVALFSDDNVHACNIM